MTDTASASLQSMTGFGRAQAEADGTSVLVEVRSVNHRNLDVQVRLDRSLAAVEQPLANVVRERLDRGRVDLTVTLSDAGSHTGLPVAALRGVVDDVAAAFDGDPRVSAHTDLGPLITALATVEPAPRILSPALMQTLLDTAGRALDELQSFRVREGNKLFDVLMRHHSAARELVEGLRAQTEQAPADKLARLQERIATLSIDLPEDRLAQELALIADRIDVSEELDRLALHLDHFLTVTRGPQAGRKLSFLCQELLREANTVGSKVQDATAAHLVVDLKVVIERLREQVQNLA